MPAALAFAGVEAKTILAARRARRRSDACHPVGGEKGGRARHAQRRHAAQILPGQLHTEAHGRDDYPAAGTVAEAAKAPAGG